MRRTGKAIGTLAAATSLVMLGSGLAFADNIVNNVDDAITTNTTADDVLVTQTSAGSSVAQDVRYKVNGAGQSCSATATTPVTYTLTVPEPVAVALKSAAANTAYNASTKTLTFESCDSSAVLWLSFSTSSAGVHAIAGAVSGTVNDQADWTWRVSAPASTPTTTTCATIPAAPAVVAPTTSATTGWSNLTTHPSAEAGAEDVAPSFTLNPATGAQYKIGTTGTWTNYTAAVSLGDGQHSVSTRSVVATNGSCDTEGDESSPTLIKVDRTSPVNTVMDGSVAATDGRSYLLGATLPTLSCKTTDAGSGVSAAAGDTVALGAVEGGAAGGLGDFNVTCSGGKDVAGNDAADATLGWSVTASLSRFAQPINDFDGAKTSAFKQGSTIPAKIQLLGADGSPISDAAASEIAAACSLKLGSKAGAAVTPSTTLETTSTTPANSGQCFRYDASADQFVFNLGTKLMAKGAWTLTANLFAGSVTPIGSHAVAVSLV